MWGWGRWLGWAKNLPGIGPKVLRLSRRRLPETIRSKTRTFNAIVLWATFQQWRNRRDANARVRESLHFNRAFGDAVVREGFGGATHLFSMLGEGGSALPAARARGLKIVVEVYILLSSQYIMEEESRRFPDWEAAPPDHTSIWKDFSDINALPFIDLAICPSEAVREDLARNFGVPMEKSLLLPYGLDPELLKIEPQPVPGPGCSLPEPSGCAKAFIISPRRRNSSPHAAATIDSWRLGTSRRRSSHVRSAGFSPFWAAFPGRRW